MLQQIDHPLTLFTPNTFDVCAKTIYGRFFLNDLDSSFGKRIYAHHLQVWNGLREYKPHRIGLTAFTENFQSIVRAIRDGTFDFERSPIPINAAGKLINGRHRLAAALLCNQPVITRECPDSEGKEICDFSHLCDRTYHYSKGLHGDYADAMATEYVALRKNTFIATVFCDHRPDQIIETMRYFGQPVYWKSVNLTGDARFNLMRELYLDEAWLKDWQGRFSGARLKAEAALQPEQSIGVYLFECESLRRVLECKKLLRIQFDAGQHALHINDTHEETKRLAGVLFNRNSIDFLNRSRLRGYPGFQSMLEEYRQFLRGKDSNDFCVDGSAVLAAYGLRECRDLDFISRTDGPGPSSLVNNHNEELHHHVVSRDDLLYNPENFFWHSGVKFVALHQMEAMKARRNEPKDRRDIRLIRRMGSKWRKAVARFLHRSSR